MQRCVMSAWFYAQEKEWLQQYILFQQLLRSMRFAFYNTYMVKPFYQRLSLYSHQNMTQTSHLLKLHGQIENTIDIIERSIDECNASVHYFFYKQNLLAQKKEIAFLKSMAMFSGEYITREKAQGILDDLNVKFTATTNNYLELCVYFVTRNHQGLKDLVERHPSLYWGHMVRAIQLFCEEKFTEGQLVSLACVALDPEHFFPYFLVVLCSFDDVGTAKKFLTKMNRFREEDAYFHLLLGDIYFYHNMFAKATAVLERWVTIQPDNRDVRYQRAIVYIKQNRFTEAIADLNFLVKNNHKDLDAYLQRGLVYLERKMFSEALADFKSIIAHNSKSQNGHFYCGVVLSKMHKWQEALNSFNEAILLDQDYKEAIFHRGIAFLNLQIIDKAHRDFSKVFYVEKYRSSAYFYLACVYALQDKKVEACSLLEECLRLGEISVQQIADEDKLSDVRRMARYQDIVKRFQGNAGK